MGPADLPKLFADLPARMTRAVDPCKPSSLYMESIRERRSARRSMLYRPRTLQRNLFKNFKKEKQTKRHAADNHRQHGLYSHSIASRFCIGRPEKVEGIIAFTCTQSPANSAMAALKNRERSRTTGTYQKNKRPM